MHEMRKCTNCGRKFDVGVTGFFYGSFGAWLCGPLERFDECYMNAHRVWVYRQKTGQK